MKLSLINNYIFTNYKFQYLIYRINYIKVKTLTTGHIIPPGLKVKQQSYQPTDINKNLNITMLQNIVIIFLAK